MVVVNVIVAILSAALVGWMFWRVDRPVAVVLALAYLLRLLVLYADTYHLFPNPFTGLDTEDFHTATLAFLAGDGPIKTNYTYVLAVFYRLSGDYGRFAAQFLNVLLSFGTVALLYWALRMLKVSRKSLLVALSVVAFMPATVCLSGVLLREAWIQFFVMLSACCFIQWYQRGGIGNEVACMAATFAAMLMHAGCVGALAVYMIGFLVCRTWKTEGVRTYALTVCVMVLFMLPMLVFPGLLLAKFVNAADSGLDIVPVVAGSTYLLWMQKLGVGLRLLLSPVRMFYLLFSPLPFDWRGLSDVAVFCVDSLVYVVLVVLMFRPPLLGGAAQLKRFLGYAVLVLTFVFALGTTNAGTAVRHRAKFLPVVVLAAAYPAKKTSVSDNSIL
jgi:hypothetical protein